MSNESIRQTAIQEIIKKNPGKKYFINVSHVLNLHFSIVSTKYEKLFLLYIIIFCTKH